MALHHFVDELKFKSECFSGEWSKEERDGWILENL